MVKQQLEQHVSAARARLEEQLLQRRNARGVWEGRLSGSALATAVAIFALRRIEPDAAAPACRAGAQWLVDHVNADGSWGDTPVSAGNLSTTLLCLAALRDVPDEVAGPVRRGAEDWVSRRCGGMEADTLAQAVLSYYGGDRSFSVPILTMCALAGMLGPAPDCWSYLPQLPFELALLPRWSFSLVGLPVVSYALPALIAMGWVRWQAAPSRWTPWRAAVLPALQRRLEALQPANGGFLEATPLTGFVAMSVAAADRADHPVVRRAADFLRQSQRRDGGWPIDTNLATWLTTLGVRALRGRLVRGDRALAEPILAWLLAQQGREPHPYTAAAPGGWGWTDLPGSVPDADDTAGALLALRLLDPEGARTSEAGRSGLIWLLDLANRDGGIPTFCRGWGRFPFDRSCADITAHVLRAFQAWQDAPLPTGLKSRMRQATRKALLYLRHTQREDGSWLPLWFGNEAASDQANPVYGTARVLQALNDLPQEADPRAEGPDADAAARFLVECQHADGGWGGDRGVAPSLEETALAITALAPRAHDRREVDEGVRWLLRHLDRRRPPAAIGLYFAGLWYYEELYPLLFTLEAFATWLHHRRPQALSDTEGGSTPFGPDEDQS